MKKGSQSLIFTLMLLASSTPVYAAEPSFVSSTVNLLNDATTWILVLIPSATAVKIGYHVLEKQMSDNDSAVVGSANKKITSALKWGAIGVSIVGIVKTVLSYYQS